MWTAVLLALSTSIHAGVGLFPVAAYTPETGAIGGAYAQGVGRVDSLHRPDQLALWLTLAVKGQAEVGLRPELWWAENAWTASGELGYQHWPAAWHGTGPRSPSTALEFTAERVKVEVSLRRRLADRLHGGACYSLVRESLGGPASASALKGAAGRDAGAGGELSLDSRDDTVWPQSGHWLLLRAQRHGAWLGGDWPYSRWLADGRAYRSVAGGVVAGQLAVEGRGGQVPARALPKLGEWLRAVEDLRFVDRWASAARVEWRQPLPFTLPTRLGQVLSRRAGLVAFAEAGQVGPRGADLLAGPLKHSLGLGGRFALLPQERLNVRADVAFGSEGALVRIKVGEEF